MYEDQHLWVGSHLPELPLIGPGIDPKAIQRWLNDLPKANINKSAWLIYNALLSLYECNVSGKDWFNALELYRPTVLLLCQALATVSSTEVYTVEQQQSAHKAYLLELTLARAYKQVAIIERHNLEPLYLATSIHRALNHYTYVLIHNFQTYHEIPPTLWNSIYQLYSCARDEQLLRLVIVDQAIKNRQSIMHLFKQILLLATANPYQLPEGDILHVWQLAPLLVDELVFSEQYVESYLFGANLTSDQPPGYRHLFANPLDATQCCSFDSLVIATTLERKLATMLEQEHFVYPGGHCSKRLIQHLIEGWSAFPKRSFSRIPQSGELITCLGLVNIHYAIKSLVVENKTAAPVTGLASENTIPHYPKQRWDLINVSPGGYCLCVGEQKPEDINVGELVGLQQQDELPEKATVFIGMIRWVKYTNERELRVGVQLLAPHAILVHVRNLQHAEQDSEYLPALLLPAEPALNQPPTLITPILPFRVNDRLRVVAQDVDSDIKLSQCISHGSRFNQFLFDVITHYASDFEFQ
ncbi:MAG: hypothetical protein Tsb005_18150 [Gammaproteobacteria bacterium]